MPSFDLLQSLGGFRQNLEQGALRVRSLVRPKEFQGLTRLYQLQPYRKGRIPVMFIHGLKSTPSVWLQAVRMVCQDAELRTVFHPMVYFYPTGAPILLSIDAFRRRLRAFVDECSSGLVLRQMEEMVLVGHSLGGIISSAQIRSSDAAFAEAILDCPMADAHISEDDRNTLRTLLVFQANPTIGRVIFVCTPHRGSDRVGGWIERLSKALVHQKAETIVRIPKATTDKWPLSPEQQMDRLLARLPNSIQGLKAGSHLLNGLLNLTTREGVRYHSIIGNKGKKGPLRESSDGWVPYWSSHLEGADSEQIVPTWHAATEHAETLAEIRRILLLHAEQVL